MFLRLDHWLLGTSAWLPWVTGSWNSVDMLWGSISHPVWRDQSWLWSPAKLPTTSIEWRRFCMILFPIRQVIPKFEPETNRGSRSYETEILSPFLYLSSQTQHNYFITRSWDGLLSNSCDWCGDYICENGPVGWEGDGQGGTWASCVTSSEAGWVASFLDPWP